jgi:putative salt-induced outer membrane protein YdiY
MKTIFRLLLFSLFVNLLVPSAVVGQLDFGLTEGEIVEEVDSNPWTGAFAAGLNGKSGNSQSLDINTTLDLARDTDFSNTTLLASYFYTANDVATVTDRFFGQGRQERKLRNPRWSLFGQAAVEWDRFKAFDYRIALHGGLGFEVYKLDDRFLKLRFGAGASREVGGTPDEWIPELQFGADWERQLTETVRLYANVDYFPNVEDFADYRLNTRAGVDFVVDAERNINFRMFAFNRYDSTPPVGNVENDIDYGMALVVGF